MSCVTTQHTLFLDNPQPKGPYVIAIDVGIMNLGLAVFDFNTRQVVHWDRVSLCHGRYMPSKNVDYIRDFIARNEHFFLHCFVVLIERQIRCNMRIVESGLQALFHDRCIIISAKSIKVHFGISLMNYRNNKSRAVEWAAQFITANPYAFSPGVQSVFNDNSKRDDLADALLLLMYYLDTYSNQLTTSFQSPSLDVSAEAGRLAASDA